MEEIKECKNCSDQAGFCHDWDCRNVKALVIGYEQEIRKWKENCDVAYERLLARDLTNMKLEAEVQKLVEALTRTNKLMYGLGLDLRQSSLAQKIIDENRVDIAAGKETLKKHGYEGK